MTKEQPETEEARRDELRTPRDWDGLILRFIQPTPDGLLDVEARDPETQRWRPSGARPIKVARAPYATHDEMDEQGVPAADRTRFNPERCGEDLRSIPRIMDGLIVRFVKEAPGKPLVLEKWDKSARRWRPYSLLRKVTRSHLGRKPPIATDEELDAQGVPSEDRVELIRNWWDELRK